MKCLKLFNLQTGFQILEGFLPVVVVVVQKCCKKSLIYVRLCCDDGLRSFPNKRLRDPEQFIDSNDFFYVLIRKPIQSKSCKDTWLSDIERKDLQWRSLWIFIPLNFKFSTLDFIYPTLLSTLIRITTKSVHRWSTRHQIRNLELIKNIDMGILPAMRDNRCTVWSHHGRDILTHVLDHYYESNVRFQIENSAKQIMRY